MKSLLAAAGLVAGLCCGAAADPSSPALDEATAAVRSGDRKKALELLASTVKTNPPREQRESIALLYAELKDYATAQAQMNALIRESPREARLRLYLATIVARAGDRGATLAALGEARKRNPNAVDRQRMAFLHQDFKDYGPARDLLDGLIAESPGDLSVRLDRASLAAQTKDIPGGLAHLAAARALKPGPAERRRMAALYRDLGELGLARALIDELIGESPASAGLLFERASLAMLSGDRAAALAALAAARERGPSLEERRRIAAFYQEMKEPGEARAVLSGLVRDMPRNTDARLDLAALDARRGERAAALESLAAARKMEPDLQHRQRMALLYEDLKEYKTARGVIDALIAEQPSDPQLRLDRAYFAADTGDKAAALAFLAETRRRSPDPDDRRRMAALYERLGEQGEARAVIDESDKKSR
jgi:predicted Zn-dependent protease